MTQPTLNPPRKRRQPPPSQLSSPDEATGRVIEEISRDLATGGGGGHSGRSTKPKTRRAKLTAWLREDYMTWFRSEVRHEAAKHPDQGKTTTIKDLLEEALDLLRDRRSGTD